MLKADQEEVRRKSKALGYLFQRLIIQVHWGNLIRICRQCLTHPFSFLAIHNAHACSLDASSKQSFQVVNLLSEYTYSASSLLLVEDCNAVHLNEILAEQECSQFNFKLVSPENIEDRGSQINYCHDEGYAVIQVILDAF